MHMQKHTGLEAENMLVHKQLKNYRHANQHKSQALNTPKQHHFQCREAVVPWVGVLASKGEKTPHSMHRREDSVLEE